MSSSRPCQALRKDGQPCGGRALPSVPYCFNHAPDLAEKRQAARAKGGANSARQRRLAKLCPPRLLSVFEALEAALGEVHDGELDPRVASAMAALAGAMVRVLSHGELEQRLRDLEARLVADSTRREARR